MPGRGNAFFAGVRFAVAALLAFFVAEVAAADAVCAGITNKLASHQTETQRAENLIFFISFAQHLHRLTAGQERVQKVSKSYLRIAFFPGLAILPQ